MTRFTTIGLGIASLSVAGLAFLNSIRESVNFVPGSAVITGNQFLIPDANTTTAPGMYLNDETTPIRTYPVTYGTEYCYGHTGALLCSITLKLTGSGGHRNHNAGSFVCTSSTCSVIRARVFTESGSDALYGGWTTSPGSASGAQVFNAYAPSIPRGGSILGSGSYVYSPGGVTTQVHKNIPPGATFKFVWKVGNGTEDYSRTKAAATVEYYKYYNP